MLEATIHAFRDELRKEATTPLLGAPGLLQRAKPVLQRAGALGGVGALGGAAIGAGLGGAKGYREARAEGAGVGGAALHGLLGAGGGAIRGAGYGALAGAGAGAFSKLDTSKLTAGEGLIHSAARSGQRQVHALTGMLTPGELEGVRGGAFDARKALETARGLPHEAKAQKAFTAADTAQHMGLTSVPGYLRALKDRPVSEVLGASAREQYHGMHPALGAVMVGLPAASAVGTLANKESPTGPGKGEELGRNLGGAVGGVMGGMMPVGGAEVMNRLGTGAGAGVGRVIDRIRGRKPLVNDLGNPSTLEPTESQNTPSERVTSPSAAGGQKDIGL